MSKPRLSIFTSTYNRAHTLGRTYESLCQQTCGDFCWVIVDDGSTDTTRDLVLPWLGTDVSNPEPHVYVGVCDAGFSITYAYKENGGLHTGYNRAIELMNTELCVCIDSDDWCPDDAVEKILRTWEKRGNNHYAGIVGLDCYEDGSTIGKKFPRDLESTHIYEYDFKYGHVDRKIVMRCDLLREVAPMPSFKGEKNFNPMYMITKIDIKFPFIVLNEHLCFVEYQEEGMSNAIFKQYTNSPNSFATLRLLSLSLPNAPLLYKIRQYIHLGSSALFSRNFNWFNKTPNPVIAYLCFPLSLLLSIYINIKSKR